MGRFEVVTRFRPGGPAVTGRWTSEETAGRKFRGLIGLYGDQAPVSITLSRSNAGSTRVLRTWAKERGEAVFPP